MIALLIIVPLIGALAAFFMPRDRYRPWIVAVAAAIHTVLSVEAVRMRMGDAETDWLQLDPLGGLVLLVISTIFLICAAYCVGYQRWMIDATGRGDT